LDVRDPIEDLTPRERRVREELRKGKSNKQIARDLGVAESTVARHVTNILAKLGVDSRTAAATYGTPAVLEQPIAPLTEKYLDRCYQRHGSVAEAIRLIGAADEFFPPAVLHLTLTDEKYELPEDLAIHKERIVKRLSAEAERNNGVFFDGSATRIIRGQLSDEPRTRSLRGWFSPTGPDERKHLFLTLGRVGWYDYSVVNYRFGQNARYLEQALIADYLDLDRIAESAALDASRLTNITGTATTIITGDGHLLYSLRSERVSAAQHALTSAVAENIHWDKDRDEEGCPNPFLTVARGIKEELSPRLVPAAGRGVYLLGMAFSLHQLHPDFLFAYFTEQTMEEVYKACREAPGPDFFEGKLRSVVLDVGESALHDALKGIWVANGKASVLRAVEFLEAIELAQRRTQKDAIQNLARRTPS
jgi:DNA-binding CsgD family transcriptional regulator